MLSGDEEMEGDHRALLALPRGAHHHIDRTAPGRSRKRCVCAATSTASSPMPRTLRRRAATPAAVMAGIRRATGLPTATNMIATDWRQMAHSILLQSVSIPTRRSAFSGPWPARCASVHLPRLRPDLGLAFNNHFDVSLAMFTRRRRRSRRHPRRSTPIGSVADGAPDQGPLKIRGGNSALPKGGLGIEIDRTGGPTNST